MCRACWRGIVDLLLHLSYKGNQDECNPTTRTATTLTTTTATTSNPTTRTATTLTTTAATTSTHAQPTTEIITTMVASTTKDKATIAGVSTSGTIATTALAASTLTEVRPDYGRNAGKVNTWVVALILVLVLVGVAFLVVWQRKKPIDDKSYNDSATLVCENQAYEVDTGDVAQTPLPAPADTTEA